MGLARALYNGKREKIKDEMSRKLRCLETLIHGDTLYSPHHTFSVCSILELNYNMKYVATHMCHINTRVYSCCIH